MRPCFLAGAVLIPLFAAVSGAADLPPAPPAMNQTFPSNASFEGVPVNPLPASPAGPTPREWSVDFIFGLPMGMRAQRSLGEDGSSPWLVEGFLGFELIFPGVGAGVRRRLELFRGTSNTLLVSPGVDGYLFYDYFSSIGGWFGGGPPCIGLLGGDIDLIWEHRASERWEGLFGLKLGAGAETWIGKSMDPPTHRILVLPIVGVFGGWRF